MRTTEQLLAVVERELTLRRTGYAAMVEAGKIDRAIAEARTSEMQDVYDFIANVADTSATPKRRGAGQFPLQLRFDSDRARADFIETMQGAVAAEAHAGPMVPA